MQHNHSQASSPAQQPDYEQWQDFLTPEQRLQAVANILGAIAVRVVKKRNTNNHVSDHHDSNS